MNKKIWLHLSAGLCVGLLPAMAQAQDKGAADKNTTNDIVVTANKREENLSKVGLTITAVGAAALQTRRVASLEDVAGIAPGLIYTPSTNNTPIFTLRGIGFNESSLGVYPAVSVYVDQIPLPFPILAMHSAYDLERIEVLKGPQGTLFGQNSTGGAINYIAAKPTQTFQAGGDMSFGRFNAIEGNGYISGPLSEGVRARLAVTGKNSDPWQYSYTQPGEKNGKESYVAGRLTVDVDAGDKVKLELSANGWKDTSDPQAQQLIAIHEQIGSGATGAARHELDATPLVDPIRNSYSIPPAGCADAEICYPFSPFNGRAADWGVQVVDPNTSPADAGGSSNAANATTTSFRPRGDRDFWQLGLRADVDLGVATLTSLTSYAKFRQNMTIDGDGMSLASFDINQAKGNIRTFNQELRLANDPHSRIRWVIGGNLEKSKTFEDQILRYWANSNYNAGNLYINHSGIRLSQNITNWAIFGNTEFDVTDRLTLKASGRYTHSQIDVVNAAYTGVNGNVDKLFNFLGGPLGGNTFTPITPDQSYTLNGDPANVTTLPDGLTITSPVNHAFSGTPGQPGFLNLGIPGVPFTATLKQHNVSWRFGFDYKVTDDVLFYANVSRGFKAGSFPALAAASYISALPVTQEKVTAYEAGLKVQALDGKVQFNTAGFYMDYRDKQVKGKLFDFVFGTLDTLVNVPKSRIYGMEADLTVRPTHELTISGAVTWLKSKVLKFTGYDAFGGVDNNIDPRPGNFDPSGLTPNTENLAGSRLPYTPEWAGSINVDYRHEMSGGGAPFAGFTVNMRSNQTAAIGGEDTTLPTGGNVRYRIAPGVGKYPYMIDGYATVDARLGYEGPDGAWRVMLWGKNLFNKYYWTAVIPSSDSSARLAGKPVTYGVTLGFKIR